MDEQNTWSQHLQKWTNEAHSLHLNNSTNSHFQLYSDNNLINSRSTLKMTHVYKNQLEKWSWKNGRTKHMVCIDHHATTITITWSRGLCSSETKIAQRKMASGLSPRATARLVCVLLRRMQSLIIRWFTE